MIHACRTKPRRQLSALPLPRRRQPSRPRPVLLIAVGELGRSLIGRMGRTEHDAGQIVAIADDSTPDDWQRALRRIRRHGGEHSTAAGSDAMDAILVGSRDDILASWERLDSQLDGDSQPTRLRKLVLQIGGLQLATTLPADCRGWFHWTPAYVLGDLTQEQAVALAVRMLRSGLAPALVDIAIKEAFLSPVSVGAACGWVPEMTVGEAIAGHLVAALAASFARPAALRMAKVPALVGPDLTLAIRQRLAAHFRRGSNVLARQFRQQARRGCLPDLSGDVAVDGTAADEMVQAWEQSYREVIEHQLIALCDGPDGLAAARAMIDDAIRQLAVQGNDLRNQLTAISSQRQRLANMAAAAYQRQLAARQQGALSRWPKVWWETRKTDRWLGQFTDASGSELTIRSVTQCLHELSVMLAAIKDRLLNVTQASDASRAVRRGISQSGHPCLVALYDSDSIRTAVGVLANDLLLRPGRSPERELWRVLIASVLAGHSAEESWTRTSRDARRLVGVSTIASQPLAIVCRGMVPRFRDAELKRVLARVAEPRPLGPAGRPWFECVQPLHDSGLPERTRGVIYLRCQA